MADPVRLSSSHIASAHHEGDTLTLTFKDGTRYAYDGVPAEAHAALVGATSAGRHFRQHIKGRYPHRKLA